MTISYTNSVNEYKDFIKYYCFNYLLKKNLVKALFFTTIPCLFYLIDGTPFEALIAALRIFIILSIIVFLISFIKFLSLNSSLNKKIEPWANKTQNVFIDEKCISFETQAQKRTLNWWEIKSILTNNNYIYLMSVENEFYVIPTELNLHEILNELHKYYEPIRDLKQKKAIKKNYYWAITGILPNFGVITGVVLIYNGLLKWKKTALIVLGVLSISWSFIFWYMVNKTESLQPSPETSTIISETSLSLIQKQVINYHKIHHEYPESLNQLLHENKGLNLSDYFVPDEQVVYLKSDSNFILISRGIDKTLNTKDDINLEYKTATNKGSYVIRAN